MSRAFALNVGAKRVDELVVFQLADDLRNRVHALATIQAVRYDRRFCNQLQDAASAVTRNIAEGFGRFSHREFAQYLTIARGPVFELQDHLRDGTARKHWSNQEVAELHSLCNRTIAALTSLTRYLKTHRDI